MGQNKPIPPYLCGDNDGKRDFAMIKANLLQAEGFQELSRPAQLFYLTCCAHKNTEMQRQCLYKTLEEYHALLDDDISKYDLQLEAGQVKNCKDDKMYFVFPSSHLKLYGISPQYASKYKKELIQKGFIRVVGNEKGKGKANMDFSKRITIYAFTTKWKTFSS